MTDTPPGYRSGKVKINWIALGVISLVVIAISLISWMAGLTVAVLIALGLVMNNIGTGRLVHGSIGDDMNAAYPKRDRRPRDD